MSRSKGNSEQWCLRDRCWAPGAAHWSAHLLPPRSERRVHSSSAPPPAVNSPDPLPSWHAKCHPVNAHVLSAREPPYPDADSLTIVQPRGGFPKKAIALSTLLRTFPWYGTAVREPVRLFFPWEGRQYGMAIELYAARNALQFRRRLRDTVSMRGSHRAAGGSTLLCACLS